MAFDASTHWEVQTGGADGTTGNGGGFAHANANMATDLAADSNTGNTASSVVSSASYNFAAGDVGHWLFIKAGTDWTPGWYQIASVASNKATLAAAAGAGILVSTHAPTTAVGAATVGTPTGGTWSIDYSQSTGAGITYTDMVIDGTTNTIYASAGNPVGKNIIGNVIAVSSGAGFTVQRVQVVSTSGTQATVDKSLGTLGSTGGNGKLGGALASPGQAGALMIGGNEMWVKSGTYSVTSASTNVAAGCPSLPAGASASATTRMIGYGSLRGDNGTKPLLQASGAISTFVLVTQAANSILANVELDGALKTSARGITGSTGGSVAIRCKLSNCTNNAVSLGTCILCEATGCTTSTAFSACFCVGCVAHSNAATAYNQGSGNAACIYCFAISNSGATSDGFRWVGNGTRFINCVAYNNGRHGFFQATTAATIAQEAINCLAVSNAGYGFAATAAVDYLTLINCAGYDNDSGLVDTATISTRNTIGLITLTADPFVNAAGNDFSLSGAAAGLLLRAAGIPGLTSGSYSLPGLSTNSYLDVGAVQHKDGGHIANLLGGLFQ